MSWVTPRTWVLGETVTAALMTAAMFNAHIRDNLLVLKTTRNSVGRLIDISSATVADLSGAGVTGLARVGSGNSFTAGTSKFAEAARVVIPVGADKYEDLGGGLRRGFWVEGDYLHHMASNQTTEYRYLGSYVSTPAGALPGSVWIEGEYLHYIDEDGDERRCNSTSSGHADAAAIAGSCWVETYVHWIREGGSVEKPGHADVSHADGTEHSDTHSDVAHGDSHSDVGHSDSHADEAHSDSHTDHHGDVHQDHDDSPFHQDKATESHADSHDDSPHSDTHSDVAAESSHSDSHTDSHDDHSDHGDVAAQNQPVAV